MERTKLRAFKTPGNAFKLYDTFGLPLDFMVDAARDQGIQFDQAGFDAAMEEQRTTRPRQLEGRLAEDPHRRSLPRCRRRFSKATSRSNPPNCEVLAIVVDGQGAQQLLAPARTG